MNKNGFKLKPFGTYEYFTKDENGNVFRKLSKDGKYNYFNLDRKQNDTYYAVSDDNNLYSIDLSKLPVGQEFFFCNRPYTIETLIPKGAIIKYGNETIKPVDSCDYKKLIFCAKLLPKDKIYPIETVNRILSVIFTPESKKICEKCH